MNGDAICWKSSKQDTIADSIVEVEYIATTEATKDIVQMKKLIINLGVMSGSKELIPLFCDNDGVIAQAKEHGSFLKSKHF